MTIKSCSRLIVQPCLQRQTLRCGWSVGGQQRRVVRGQTEEEEGGEGGAGGNKMAILFKVSCFPLGDRSLLTPRRRNNGMLHSVQPHRLTSRSPAIQSGWSVAAKEGGGGAPGERSTVRVKGAASQACKAVASGHWIIQGRRRRLS